MVAAGRRGNNYYCVGELPYCIRIYWGRWSQRNIIKLNRYHRIRRKTVTANDDLVTNVP